MSVFPWPATYPVPLLSSPTGPGIAPPPLAWPVTEESCAAARPGLSPGFRQPPQDRSHSCGSRSLSNPRPHSMASLRATPRPDRPPPPLGQHRYLSPSAPSRGSPSTQLIGTSCCEVGRAVFLKPIGPPLPVSYSAPGLWLGL